MYGIGCRLAKGEMNIYVLKEDIVKVKYASLQKLDAKRSLVISLVYSYLKNFTGSANKDEIIITTSKLKIKIKKTNQAIAFTDLNNVFVNGKSISNHTINAGDKGNKEIMIVLG